MLERTGHGCACTMQPPWADGNPRRVMAEPTLALSLTAAPARPALRWYFGNPTSKVDVDVACIIFPSTLERVTERPCHAEKA